MRVFIALAVGMSTFFVPSAIGFPIGLPKQSEVEGVAGKNQPLSTPSQGSAAW